LVRLQALWLAVAVRAELQAVEMVALAHHQQ
jgi:hypothetical protein